MGFVKRQVRADWVGLVGLFVAEHGELDVAAAAGEADEGALAFALSAFAVVVDARGRVCEGCERGEEERAFELFVAALGWVFSADGDTGAAGDRGEACVGSQMTRVFEGAAVANLEQDPCRGPDPDARHRGQDLGKRVSIEYPFDFAGDLVTLRQDIAQGAGQAGEDLLRRGRTGTVTVCSSKAVMICVTSPSPMRGAFFEAISNSLERPALRSPAGPPQRDSSSRTALCCTFGLRTRSSAGWI
jgi:hypothetical protein